MSKRNSAKFYFIYLQNNTNEIPKSIQLIKIIRYFLFDNSFQINKDTTPSSTRNIHAEVPQGSCMSPHFFLIYVNNRPLLSEYKLALFADDILFM